MLGNQLVRALVPTPGMVVPGGSPVAAMARAAAGMQAGPVATSVLAPTVMKFEPITCQGVWFDKSGCE